MNDYKQMNKEIFTKWHTFDICMYVLMNSKFNMML